MYIEPAVIDTLIADTLTSLSDIKPENIRFSLEDLKKIYKRSLNLSKKNKKTIEFLKYLEMYLKK